MLLVTMLLGDTPIPCRDSSVVKASLSEFGADPWQL